MCGFNDSDRVGTHKEAAPKRRRRDEDFVNKLVSTITSGLMTGPFCLDDVDSEGKTTLPIDQLIHECDFTEGIF